MLELTVPQGSVAFKLSDAEKDEIAREGSVFADNRRSILFQLASDLSRIILGFTIAVTSYERPIWLAFGIFCALIGCASLGILVARTGRMRDLRKHEPLRVAFSHVGLRVEGAKTREIAWKSVREVRFLKSALVFIGSNNVPLLAVPVRVLDGNGEPLWSYLEQRLTSKALLYRPRRYDSIYNSASA